MKAGLSDVAIRKMQTPVTGQIEDWDGKVPGFGLRVSSSGTKAFALLYRFEGKPRRMTLGRYPVLTLAEARDQATDPLKQIDKGIDPSPTKQALQEQERGKATYAFDAAVKSFVKLHGERHNRPVTARDTERLLNNRFVSKLGAKDNRAIKRLEIIQVLDEAVEQGYPSGASHALSAIQKFFNWCVERGMLDHSPCDGVKTPAKDRTRDRILDDDELKAIWKAADIAGHQMGSITKLPMLTAQRRGEVAGMQGQHLDLKERLQTLPTELTKSHRQHIVPLTDTMILIIKNMPVVNETYVFSISKTAGPFADYTFGKTATDDIARINDWTLHDLRRTAATKMAKLGTAPHVVERILNHASGTFGRVVLRS